MSSPSARAGASKSTSSSDEAVPTKRARLETNEPDAANAGASVLNVVTSDGKPFAVELDVILQSKLIKDMLDRGVVVDGNFVIPNVTSEIYEKILEWCQRHIGDKEYDIHDKDSKSLPIPVWDEEWFRPLPTTTIMELCKAANFLDIPILLDLTCKALANMMTGKTAAQIREQFNMVNDFSPQDEEVFDKEPIWCDEI